MEILSVSTFGLELNLLTVLIIIVGTFLGLLSGTIPGLGPAVTIALLIPLLGNLPEPVALVLLGSTYLTGVYGGSISAILMNIPGTGASAATVLDGYPMSQKGKAITALSISTTSSIIGGLVSLIIIVSSTSYLVTFVLSFASPEYFLMIIVGLTIIAIISQGNMINGLIAGVFGLVIASVGVADTSGNIRYTFDLLYLYDGIQFIPALIGVFAVTEMMMLAGREQQISETTELLGSSWEGIKTTLKYKLTLLRSSLIGLVVGGIPGAGGTIANFVAYGITTSLRRSGSEEIEFGEGNPEGIVSAESSNNALVSGSLVPALTFGIPGNSTTAVMLGALLYLGLQPGPALFNNNIEAIYLIYLGVFFGILFLMSMYLLAPILGKVTTTDRAILIPTILVVSLLGTYSLRHNYGDVVTMFLFGLLGYIMIRHNYSIIALILGLILGPIAESTLWRTIQISGGDPMIFINRPLSAILVLVIIFILTFAFVDLRRIWRSSLSLIKR
jgi:putative tricarboxylic transport membrane protein